MLFLTRRSFINVSKSGYGEKIYKKQWKIVFYGLMSVLFAMIFGFTVHETIRR